MLLCQSQKFCRQRVCLREALIREVFKIQGYWSFLKAKTEQACSLFENPRFFISNQLFLKNIQEVLVVFPCQLKTMLTPQKLPWSNYHPLKGILTKAVPALSLQLHRAPRVGFGEFRSWRTGVAWGSVIGILFTLEKKTPSQRKNRNLKSNNFQKFIHGRKLGGQPTRTILNMFFDISGGFNSFAKVLNIDISFSMWETCIYND